MSKALHFSLSVEKQVANQPIGMETELNKAIIELNVRTILSQSKIIKKRGVSTLTLFFLIILLPFIKKGLVALWTEAQLKNKVHAEKDTWYRFLNQEGFNWRKAVILLALKVIAACDQVALKHKALLVDDTLILKTGAKIELVSYHYDHTTRRHVLGHQGLQLGYSNGVNFFPVDMALHTSRRRPNLKLRQIDKRTHGWRRRQESLRKKTDVLLEMLQRAWNAGIDAGFVIFDSWFAHDGTIQGIIAIGYGVICRLKRNQVRYEYQGRAYTLKQLWQRFARKKTLWIDKHQVKGLSLRVSLPKSGPVQVVFVSDGHKQWHAFLCTDLELSASEILTNYARRWAIEVYFKDIKQMLALGQEQSRTFDALVASYSLVMMRYLFLVYILHKTKGYGPLGPLFRDLSKDLQFIQAGEYFWEQIKSFLLMSSALVFPDFEDVMIVKFIDIIENIIASNIKLPSAKL
jgi:hypothetical protein